MDAAIDGAKCSTETIENAIKYWIENPNVGIPLKVVAIEWKWKLKGKVR